MNQDYGTFSQARKPCDVWTRASQVKHDSPFQDEACHLMYNFKELDFRKRFLVLDDSKQDEMIVEELVKFWDWIHTRVTDGNWGVSDDSGKRKLSFEFHKEENSYRGAIHIDVFVTEHAPIPTDSPAAMKFAKLYERITRIKPNTNSTQQVDQMERGDLALQIDDDRESGYVSGEAEAALDLNEFGRRSNSFGGGERSEVHEPSLIASQYPRCGGNYTDWIGKGKIVGFSQTNETKRAEF